MALKALLDSLDGVPEALHEHYTQTDNGKFRLQALAAEDVKLMPAILTKAEGFITRQVEAEAAADKAMKAAEHRVKVQDRINELTQDSRGLEELLATGQQRTAASTEELNRQLEVHAKFIEARRALSDKALQATPAQLEAIRRQIDAQSQLRQAYERLIRAREAKEGFFRDLALEGEQLQQLLGIQGLDRRAREVEAELIERVMRLKQQKIDVDAREIQQIRAGIAANQQLKEAYENLNHPLKELGESAEVTLKDVKDQTLNIVGSVEDAYMSLFDGGTNSLKDFLKAMEQDMLRLGFRKLVTAPLAKTLDEMLDQGAQEGGWLARLGVATPTGKTAKSQDPLAGVTEALTRTKTSIDPMTVSLDQHALSLQSTHTALQNANTALPTFTFEIEQAAQRLAGQLIWLQTGGIQEHVQEVVGGKGGGGTTVTTYTFTASFAVGLCKGPIGGVRKLWVDGKLIYDVSSDNDGPAAKYGDILTVYLGTETQNPDPLMQSDLGSGQVPAYRGLAYVVFQDLPLADFGNRLPNLTAEVYTAGTPAYPYVAITPGPSALHKDLTRYDPAHHAIYTLYAGQLARIDALSDTLAYDIEVTASDCLTFDSLGDVYVGGNVDGGRSLATRGRRARSWRPAPRSVHRHTWSP